MFAAIYTAKRAGVNAKFQNKKNLKIQIKSIWKYDQRMTFAHTYRCHIQQSEEDNLKEAF